MGAFGGMIQTTKGRNLQAKALAGLKLNFTRIVVGDGELGGSSILDLNTLKHEVKSLNITKFKASGGQATVGAVLSNQDITTGFYWRELGLFAEDPDQGEILYCYGNAGGNAEYIPAAGGADIIEKSIDVISIVGNAQSVTATINSSLTYATAQELQDLNENINSAIIAKTNLVKTASQSYTDSKIAELVNSAPGTLDTLKELADAMGGDPNLKTNLVNMIGAKTSQSDFEAHKNDYTMQIPYGGVTTNSGNNYSINTPTIAALSAGMAISIKVNADSTGATTLNWNGKGAKAIKKANGNAAVNLKATGIYTLRYDGTNFILQGEGASGNATASDLLSGKTASTDAGDIVGTLDISQVTPSNIKKGVTIAGTVGTLPYLPQEYIGQRVHVEKEKAGYDFTNAQFTIDGNTLFYQEYVKTPNNNWTYHLHRYSILTDEDTNFGLPPFFSEVSPVDYLVNDNGSIAYAIQYSEICYLDVGTGIWTRPGLTNIGSFTINANGSEVYFSYYSSNPSDTKLGYVYKWVRTTGNTTILRSANDFGVDTWCDDGTLWCLYTRSDNTYYVKHMRISDGVMLHNQQITVIGNNIWGNTFCRYSTSSFRGVIVSYDSSEKREIIYKLNNDLSLTYITDYPYPPNLTELRSRTGKYFGIFRFYDSELVVDMYDFSLSSPKIYTLTLVKTQYISIYQISEDGCRIARDGKLISNYFYQ